MGSDCLTPSERQNGKSPFQETLEEAILVNFDEHARANF